MPADRPSPAAPAVAATAPTPGPEVRDEDPVALPLRICRCGAFRGATHDARITCLEPPAEATAEEGARVALPLDLTEAIHTFAEAHRAAEAVLEGAPIDEQRAAIVATDDAYCNLLAAIRAALQREREAREAAERERDETQAEARRTCDGSCDIALARLQFPDGTVPGSAKECAEGWHKEAHRFWRERDAEQSRADRLAREVEALEAERIAPGQGDDGTPYASAASWRAAHREALERAEKADLALAEARDALTAHERMWGCTTRVVPDLAAERDAARADLVGEREDRREADRQHEAAARAACAAIEQRDAAQAEAREARERAAGMKRRLVEIEKKANAHLGWLAGATRDDVHRLLGEIGALAAPAAPTCADGHPNCRADDPRVPGAGPCHCSNIRGAHDRRVSCPAPAASPRLPEIPPQHDPDPDVLEVMQDERAASPDASKESDHG